VVKVFESAPREPGEDEFPGTSALPFVLPGGDAHVYTASVPKRALWQRTQLASRPNAPVDRKIAALLDFLAGSLKNPTDRQRLEDRLLDGADPLDLVDVFPVVTWLTQTWAAQMNGQEVNAEEIAPPPPLVPVAPAGEVPEIIDGEVAAIEATPEPAAPVTAEAPAVQPELPPVPPTA
jgi:hypothetical protein